MNRPTTRPVYQYRPDEILNRATQHFVADGSPRCVVDSSCVYNSTGCFIGFLLTQEDADRLETLQAKGISLILGRAAKGDVAMQEAYQILSHYFNLDKTETLALLLLGQRYHDHKFATTVDDEEKVRRLGYFNVLRDFVNSIP